MYVILVFYGINSLAYVSAILNFYKFIILSDKIKLDSIEIREIDERTPR